MNMLTHLSATAWITRSSLKPIATLPVALLAACLSPNAAASPDQVATPNPPNIVLILTDDQGWSQLSHRMDARVPDSHSTYLETPNMTRLRLHFQN